MHNHLADCIARINDGILKRKDRVRVPLTKFNRAILEKLALGGYIMAFYPVPGIKNPHPLLEVVFRYTSGGDPVIYKLTLLSTPRRTLNARWKDFYRSPVVGGFHDFVITTSLGLRFRSESSTERLGGIMIIGITFYSG